SLQTADQTIVGRGHEAGAHDLRVEEMDRAHVGARLDTVGQQQRAEHVKDSVVRSGHAVGVETEAMQRFRRLEREIGARQLIADVCPAVLVRHSGTPSRAISRAMRRSRRRSSSMRSWLTANGATMTS